MIWIYNNTKIYTKNHTNSACECVCFLLNNNSKASFNFSANIRINQFIEEEKDQDCNSYIHGCKFEMVKRMTYRKRFPLMLDVVLKKVEVKNLVLSSTFLLN